MAYTAQATALARDLDAAYLSQIMGHTVTSVSVIDGQRLTGALRGSVTEFAGEARRLLYSAIAR